MRFRFFIFMATCGKNSIIGSLKLYDIGRNGHLVG